MLLRQHSSLPSYRQASMEVQRLVPTRTRSVGLGRLLPLCKPLPPYSKEKNLLRISEARGA